MPKSPGCIGANRQISSLRIGAPTDERWRQRVAGHRSAGDAGPISFSVSRADASMMVAVRPVTADGDGEAPGVRDAILAMEPASHAIARPKTVVGSEGGAGWRSVVFMAKEPTGDEPGGDDDDATCVPSQRPRMDHDGPAAKTSCGGTTCASTGSGWIT